jgi:hypothetical protein
MAQDDMIGGLNDLVWSGEFRSVPFYEPETDMLHLYIADEEDWGDVVDGRLTLFRSFKTNAVTGLSLGSIRRRLLPIVQTFGLEQDLEHVTVGMLLLAAAIAAADDGDRCKLSGPEYVEAVAPICQAAGKMRVDMPA